MSIVIIIFRRSFFEMRADVIDLVAPHAVFCATHHQQTVMCGKTHRRNVANTTALFARMRETLFQAQDRLGPVLGRRFTMLKLSRSRLLGFAAAGAFVALSASLPARAEDLAQNLGPVGPHEPILTTVGSKRVIAFYEPGGGHCAINVVVWDRSDASGDSAARVRVSLNPRQMVHIDSAESKSINLQCGDYAETLALVDASQFVAAGAAR